MSPEPELSASDALTEMERMRDDPALRRNDPAAQERWGRLVTRAYDDPAPSAPARLPADVAQIDAERATNRAKQLTLEDGSPERRALADRDEQLLRARWTLLHPEPAPTPAEADTAEAIDAEVTDDDRREAAALEAFDLPGGLAFDRERWAGALAIARTAFGADGSQVWGDGVSVCRRALASGPAPSPEARDAALRELWGGGFETRLDWAHLAIGLLPDNYIDGLKERHVFQYPAVLNYFSKLGERLERSR